MYQITNATLIKGKIFCTTDHNKQVTIDLNEKVIYGIKSDPIKSCPAFNVYVHSAYWKANEHPTQIWEFINIAAYYSPDSKEGLTILYYIDRLKNMGIQRDKIKQIFRYYSVSSSPLRSPLQNNDTYKFITKVLRTYPDILFGDAVQQYNIDKLATQYPVSFKGLTLQQKKIICDLCTQDPDTYTSIIPQLCGWMRFDHFELMYNRMYYSDGQCFWFDLTQYIRFCKQAGIEIPKKGIYTHLCNTWIIKQEKENQETNLKIAEKQKEYLQKFFYENNDFITIFPQSVQDLIDEGEAMHNCVGHNHYDIKIINGTSCIAFIRPRNNIKQSVVTCELQYNNSSTIPWNIVQFRKSSNQAVTQNDIKLLKFYSEYKDFLCQIK